MLEKVIVTFLLHQTRGKLPIGFAILHAVIPFELIALDLNGEIEPFEHFPKDVRNALVLEDPALPILRQQPDVRDDDRIVERKAHMPRTLRELLNNAVEYPVGIICLRDRYRNAFPEDLLDIHSRRLVALGFFGMKQIDLDPKKF